MYKWEGDGWKGERARITKAPVKVDEYEHLGSAMKWTVHKRDEEASAGRVEWVKWVE